MIDTKSRDKKKLSLPESAQSIEWLPNGKKIAYLARAKRQLQVWTKNINSDLSQQITKVPAGVRQFSIAPSGNSLAYSTVDIQAMKKARKRAKSEETGGVEIDILTFRASKINNNLQRRRTAPSLQLFVSKLNGDDKILVSDSLHVKDFE